MRGGELIHARGFIAELQETIARLLDERALIHDALVFYANARNYRDGGYQGNPGSPVALDEGELARKTVKAIAQNKAPASVSAIKLRRIGADVIVEAEIRGEWVTLISERHDGNFSHIVEARGIRAVVGRSRGRGAE